MDFGLYLDASNALASIIDHYDADSLEVENQLLRKLAIKISGMKTWVNDTYESTLNYLNSIEGMNETIIKRLQYRYKLRDLAKLNAKIDRFSGLFVDVYGIPFYIVSQALDEESQYNDLN